jgi:hypothetical protein
MKIYLSFLPKLFFLFAALLSTQAFSQTDSSWYHHIPADSSSSKMNMDAVYGRPFIALGKSPVAIGGYLEANTQYAATDGKSDGFSFQFRRFNIFLSSTIAKNIRFLSELEFEDGTKEVNLEYAALDFELNPLINVRGGIILNPIGGFNQNHDSPKWDFIERPVSSTTILPATLSNAGFGLHGKYAAGEWVLGYEAYLTNGFDDKVINNHFGRTSLSAGKSHPEKFEESNSGTPMVTGKLAVRHRKAGEIGISILHGVYNKWNADGIVLDKKRYATAFAFDFNAAINSRINITGELARVLVDVPVIYSQAYGNMQTGAFMDITGNIWKGRVMNWNTAKLNIGLRFDYADYNTERFRETNSSIGDYVWAIVPAIAFRPAGTTVIRFNYRYEQKKDLLMNAAAKTGVIQCGFASYF